MLKWSRSLAVRSVAALLAVHLATILIGLGGGVLEGRTTRFGGANLAMELATKDLRFADGRWTMPADGAFASLAAKNPGLWLAASDGRQTLTIGSPPEVTRALDLAAAASPKAPGADSLATLLNDAMIERQVIDRRPILIAIGGVEPETIGSVDVLRTFSLAPGLALFLGLNLLGAAALVIAVPLLLKAVRPVVEEATAIGPDPVGRRLDEARVPIELLPLVRAFNGVLDRLELELGRRKRLISNVAHELRTPLAVLSLQADAFDGPREARDGLRTEIARLERLVEQMLDLERVSLPSDRRATLDLNDVARDVVASLSPMAMDAGYDLALEPTSRPVTVVGDRQAVERAITNLVGNAISHGGRQGLIEVVVGEAWLDVSDEGPGLPPDLKPRLFEAFARGGGEATGSGLGLHLTREIMRGLGGDAVWLPDAPRTTFRLRFPAFA